MIYGDKKSGVLVQGATGKQGEFHIGLMNAYANQVGGRGVVAGVTPGKIYDAMRALEQTEGGVPDQAHAHYRTLGHRLVLELSQLDPLAQQVNLATDFSRRRAARFAPAHHSAFRRPVHRPPRAVGQRRGQEVCARGL